MKLYHTSPEKIRKIHDQGRFGSGLFFATKPYNMSVGETELYEYDADDNDIINANDFSNLEADDFRKIHHIVKDISNVTGFNEDTALGFLSENKSLSSTYNWLQEYLNSDIDMDDDEELENFNRRKRIFDNLSKKDIGQLEYDLQYEALRAAKALGKKGVALTDEQGRSYLIDMLGREGMLKHILDMEDMPAAFR